MTVYEKMFIKSNALMHFKNRHMINITSRSNNRIFTLFTWFEYYFKAFADFLSFLYISDKPVRLENFILFTI